jgi:outer membrane protein assembly factor BamE (lipoprotein component of BamABCDE complex)
MKTTKTVPAIRSKTSLAIVVSVLFSNMATAANESEIMQRIDVLEKRITILENQIESSTNINRWKDIHNWQQVKNGMHSKDVTLILGKPGRIEQQIFTTWYYHPQSKLHSFIWFDEDKVLGWEMPD